MLSKKREQESFDTKPGVLPESVNQQTWDNSVAELTVSGKPMKFYGNYADCMEMYAPPSIVAKYLDNHQEWFSRCARPMKAESLGKNGYALIIGRFASLGYEVEPKIGLELSPPDKNVYTIRTIPIPGYIAPGYDVDYNAVLALVEAQRRNDGCPQEVITQVEWKLDLTVYLQFPKFIQRLPKSLLQTTGDKLLNQIVRQVSRRLTRKVQEDFHSTVGIPFPDKWKKKSHLLSAQD
ncbi:MAG: DUF1997 domain-containing protein [Nostocaceae cyanobacterium]|nr:DUF1997 domain-containing protein [Nostocaceae cyanobacterium]